MSSEQNKQLVRDFYDFAGRGDIEAAIALLADDLTWHNIGTTAFSGRFEGKQVVLEQLVGPLFARLKSGISSTIDRLIAEGDTVVALTRGEAETLEGRPYNNTYCQVMRIRDGLICEVVEYLDTDLVNRVLDR